MPRRSISIGTMMLVAGLALGACASNGSTGSSGTTGPAAPAEGRALLTRLVTEGSDAAFDQRFGGELDGGVPAPFVSVGRAGDQAIVYVCDGASGTWFTGTVGADGAGTLRAAEGDATVELTPVDGGLRTSFSGGPFGGRAATATTLESGDGELVRLEAPAADGGPAAAVGGIIISANGVRGVLLTSVTSRGPTPLVTQPTVTTSTTSGAITDGNSNTVIIGENPTTTRTPNPTDGNSNTVIIGENPTTGAGSGSTIVSKSSGGLLTIRVSTTAGGTSTTTATAAATGCTPAMEAAGSLARTLASSRARAQNLLGALIKQRSALAAQVAKATGAGRDAAQVQLDQLDISIAKRQRQIDQLTAQIDELTRQAGPCSTAGK